MTAINWTMGEVIEIAGELYRIHSRSKTGLLNLEHTRDGRFETKSDAELATMWEREELARLPGLDANLSERHCRVLEQPFAYLPAKVQAEAEFRALYVNAFVGRQLRRRSPRVLEPLIAEVAAANGHEKPPSARQLARWLKAWNEIGSPDLRDIRCLAPRTHLRGNSHERFAPEVEEVAWDVIERLALKPQRSSGDDIAKEIDRLVDNIDAAGIEGRFFAVDHQGNRIRLNRPSRRTIYRMLKSIDRDVIVKTQRGALEAERTCEPVVRGPQPTRPLEQVEIDSTVLDVMVLDSERNIVLGRPYLTVVLDRCTRAVLGVLITFSPPSAHTLMQALRNAIRPKDDLLARYPEIRGCWPCYGKPKAIVVDNGMEYHSRSLTEACKQLGIDIIYCPVKKPRYKGRVERWFGRLSRQHLHKIPGTTFSNIKQRGNHRPEKETVMTLSDLRGSILKWIVDDYMVSIHRGINDSPLRKWKEGVHKHPVSMPARADELNVLLSNVEYRALTRKGIEVAGLLYSMRTPEFRALINRADKPDRVGVWMDYENLGSVEVENWVTGKHIKVPSVDPEYTEGLSMSEHLLLSARVKRNLKKYERVTVRALAEARNEFRELVQKLKRQKKLSGKRLRALLGEDEDEQIPRADHDKASVQEPIEAPGKGPANAAAGTAPKRQRTPASARRRKPNAKERLEQPTEMPSQGADGKDDFEAVMARMAKYGVAAQKSL